MEANSITDHIDKSAAAGDEVMLPGFRFHPTDEELVSFYLKRKIQQKPLPIELVKQLDIYKYDPWDLPKLATAGEKEWYFYCPRDRKYRNSARPNRVTGAGFWKATGTDRPIYSSEGTKCIGLKKSLVFYKGRAAKGVKTDWMMHEFRLPSLSDHSPGHLPNKKLFDKNNITPNDSWAICRIFKKANSVAQRALSHSWVSPASHHVSTGDMFSGLITATTGLHPSSVAENLSCCTTTTTTTNDTSSANASNIPLVPSNNVLQQRQQHDSAAVYPTMESLGFMFSSSSSSSLQHQQQQQTSMATMLLNLSTPPTPAAISNIDFTGDGIASVDFPFDGEDDCLLIKKALLHGGNSSSSSTNDHPCQFGVAAAARMMSLPFNVPVVAGEWKPSMQWDSCLTEMSTTAINKCYT